MNSNTHSRPLDDLKLQKVLSNESQKHTSHVQSLVRSQGSRIVAMSFDLFLIMAPLSLMTKTALVIHASGMDAGKSGQPGNEVSSLTTYLVAFNRQVSASEIILRSFVRAHDNPSLSLCSQSCSSLQLPLLSNALYFTKARGVHRSPSWNNTKAAPPCQVQSR